MSVSRPSRRASSRSRWRRAERVYGYLLAAPWIVGFFIFTAGPMLFSLVISLTDYHLTGWQWVGLANYTRLLGRDHQFLTSLANTFSYSALAVPLHILLALAVAALLNLPLPGQRVFRTMYYLPAITPGVAVALLWLYLLYPVGGPINSVLGALHLPTPPWLASPAWAKPALVLMSLWGVGVAAIIFLAGLQGVPRQLYDAAAIDGAGAFRRFRYITLPMISPTLLFNLIMGLIAALQIFDQPFIMTDGGPDNSTLFAVIYLYKQGFSYLHLGYASAIAWILFVIILLLTLLVFRSTPLWVYYEGRREAKGL